MNQVNFLQSLGWALINSFWQMALLWVVYQFITASFHKIRPAHKTSLATLLTFSGFAWFVYTFITSLLSETNSITSFYNTGLISNDNWKYFASKILPYASLIYLVTLIAPFGDVCSVLILIMQKRILLVCIETVKPFHHNYVLFLFQHSLLKALQMD